MPRKSVPPSKFMIDLQDALMNKNKNRVDKDGKEYKTAESTSKMYISYLTKLNEGKAFDDLAFLKNTDNVMEIVNRYSIPSRKTVLSAVISSLGVFGGDSRYKATSDFYEKALTGAVKDYKSNVNENEKSNKQVDNWVDLKEINDKFSMLYNLFKLFKDNESLDSDEYKTLLSLVVLSLYTLLPPRRSKDYVMMYFSDDGKVDDPEKNFYDLEDNRLVFNAYKTVKSSGQQIIDLDEDEDKKLLEILHTYFKFHPLLNSKRAALWMKEGKIKSLKDIPLLARRSGHSLVGPDINKIINSIFDGKKVGPSLLRSIHTTYITKPAIEELEGVAESMGTSVNKLMNVYNKVD